MAARVAALVRITTEFPILTVIHDSYHPWPFLIRDTKRMADELVEVDSVFVCVVELIPTFLPN
jgi:hypothetical protein